MFCVAGSGHPCCVECRGSLTLTRKVPRTELVRCVYDDFAEKGSALAKRFGNRIPRDGKHHQVRERNRVGRATERGYVTEYLGESGEFRRIARKAELHLRCATQE